MQLRRKGATGGTRASRGPTRKPRGYRGFPARAAPGSGRDCRNAVLVAPRPGNHGALLVVVRMVHVRTVRANRRCFGARSPCVRPPRGACLRTYGEVVRRARSVRDHAAPPLPEAARVPGARRGSGGGDGCARAGPRGGGGGRAAAADAPHGLQEGTRSGPTNRRRPTRTSPATTTTTSSAPTRTDPAANAGKFKTRPWKVTVRGRDREAPDGRHRRPAEVVPARGARLPHALRRGVVDGDPVDRLSARATLLKRLEPTAKAKYVAFTTLLRSRARCRGSSAPVLDWPYVEGLRMDEAHAPADAPGGRPVRRDAAEPERRAAAAGRAVEVRLQGHQVDRERSASSRASRPPPGSCMAPNEYGFYANVNPDVDHPRWSQANERRIGEFLQAQDAAVQRLRRAGRLDCTRAWTCASRSDRRRRGAAWRPQRSRRVRAAAALPAGAGALRAARREPDREDPEQHRLLDAGAAARFRSCRRPSAS